MFSGRCQEGWECKSRENCPAFKAEQKKLEGLTSLSPEWLKLVSELKELVCNKEAKKVCCKSNTGGLTGEVLPTHSSSQVNARKDGDASGERTALNSSRNKQNSTACHPSPQNGLSFSRN